MAKKISKNNPGKRIKTVDTKTYNNRPVKPIKYIDSDRKLCYIAAQFTDDESDVMDENNDPIRWDSLHST